MLILRCNGSHDVVSLIFGRGVIGASIDRGLKRKSQWHEVEKPFSWTEECLGKRNDELCNVTSALAEMLTDEPCKATRIHVVWSAGRAGFSASKQDTEKELHTFSQVVSFTQQLPERLGVPTHLHVFSSAGGLFEGVRGISPTTQPAPRRPYGELKAAQEEIATRVDSEVPCTIYRPTSVFSIVQPGKRCGLIPAVIWNTLRNRTTSIFGSYATLRDYVWAGDIGDFVADRILNSERSAHREDVLLATAVPTSIGRIVRLVEDMLMRPVNVRFITTPANNSADITVSLRSVAPGLQVTDISSAIRQVYMRLLSDGLCR